MGTRRRFGQLKNCTRTVHLFPVRICPCDRCAARREQALVQARERFFRAQELARNMREEQSAPRKP